MDIKLILICLCIFFSPFGYAEIVKAPTKIYNTPNGQALVSININFSVEVLETKNNWVRINAFPFVDNTHMPTSYKVSLQNGDVLFDIHGIKAGSVLTDISVGLWPENDANSNTPIIIQGYIPKYIILKDSVLENSLAKILNKKITFSLNDFKNHLHDFQYEVWMPHNNFVPYIEFDNPTIDPTPWPRAILFFYEGTLTAVYHCHTIKTNQIVTSKSIRNCDMGYIKGTDPQLMNKLLSIYDPIIQSAD